MRRAVSLFLVAFLISSAAISTMAQKRQVSAQVNSVTAQSTRFAGVRAYTDGFRVWLSWQMEAEVGNTGFYVHRAGKSGEELLNPSKTIRGAAMRSRDLPAYGEDYSFFDARGGLNSSYVVEAMGLDGKSVRSAQIYPEYVSDLQAVSGLTIQDMSLRGISEPPALERSVLTLTKELANEMQQNRQFSDASVHRTVISQPGSVRIGVKREGLCRVTRAQLRAAGFDVTSDPSLWQLYVEGVEQAIVVGGGASYIEFYGTAIDTPETDIHLYYLITGSTAGKRMAVRVAPANTSTVVTPSYLQTFVKKERTQYVEDIFNGALENYFGRTVTSSPNIPAYPFNLSGVDFNQSMARLELRLQGYSPGEHSIMVTLNGQALLDSQGEGQVSFTTTYDIPTSFLREGANSIKFQAGGPTGDTVFFDTISIDFSRKYLADQNKVMFYTQNYRQAKLDGFTSPNIRVFDMTRQDSPTEITNLNIQQNGSTFSAIVPAARGRAFYAVADTAILAPDSVLANNPELVSVPTNSANLIIIAYKDFMTQAETWANYRRGQGISVKVIDVREIYDEFSFGAMSSTSIKNFLQYAYTSWQTPPQYVLLIGDGSWDSRNYEGVGFFNFVPPKFVSLGHSETASDEALADFTDDGLAEIAIGRIPARTTAQVDNLFNKTVAWEAALSSTSLSTRGAIFAYDYNNGYDFAGLSSRLAAQLSSAPPTFVYRGEANANTNLINAMSSGKFIVNYTGHGTAGSWGGNPLFFNVFSVPLPTDHAPAIYTMLTCLNGYFHWLYNPSMAEVLINAQNKGAVAAWASTGLTTADVQDPMAMRFYSKLNQGDIARLGDLVKDAKTVLDSPTYPVDVRLSWSLLGDPMLKVR